MNRSLFAPAVLAASLFAALPLAVSAQEAAGLNYNYVEGGYVSTNTDAGDADGFGTNASVALAPNFHLFGGYSTQDIDDSDINVDQFRIGAGYNVGIAANTDLVARAAYEKYKTDDFTIGGVRFAGEDLDGYSAEVGVRSALAPNFEGYAMAGYEDGDEFDGDVYGRLGAQVKFNRNWGVSGDVKFADGDTQWFVGPRFSW